ncbi:conserved hypothetical protein [Hyella patelloides LEGE 07179]|uniref:Uncharacterized protein n=1 Tax=Hyella patelloides LEGE 07179 TaxID=945734 RepID=A0A563VNI9_9CYAN|nr:DUF6753 family protein [Hyella patelloides]VEP12903.1 conserved hypothetical protein [Hyella patelloides LEGE 07179]
MTTLNGKTKAVLDTCLSSESPEVKAKVYEIINVSGLDANDPMFLILALTGQMRVFLEAAPVELSKLLAEWKQKSADSLEEITAAILRVKETQQQQAQTFAKNIEQVSNQCVEDIKEAGMAATSAIASANSETLASAKLASHETSHLLEEIVELRAGVEADRKKNEAFLKALCGETGQNIKELKQVVREINHSGATIKKIQQDTVWMKLADWFSPLWALAVVGVIGFGVGWRMNYLKYNGTVEVLGREIMSWNIDRLIKCREDNNPKCTFWIVPPEQRE